MSNSKPKDINYYMSLDFTMVVNKVREDDKTYYYGKFAELDGCHTTSDTVDELINELEEVKKDYLEIKLEFGNPIPKPNELPSGKINL